MSNERNRDRERKEETKIVDVTNLYRERKDSDTVDKVLLFIFALGVVSWIYAVCG